MRDLRQLMLIYIKAHPSIDGDGTGSEVSCAIMDNAADLASATVVNDEVRNDDAPATGTVTGASTKVPATAYSPAISRPEYHRRCLA